MQNKSKFSVKKYTLVVHEFGFTPGHGGIATYALNRAKVLREWGFNLVLICFETSFDKSKTELFSDVYFVPRGLSAISAAQWISELLNKLDSDVIETSDYQGWLSDYLVKVKIGLVKNRTFIDIRHHTATKEIFEWNNFKDIRFAPLELQNIHKLELIQQRIAHRNTFPSKFLYEYISQSEFIPNSRIESYPLEMPAEVPVESVRTGNQRMQIISLGRLERRKGLIHLIDALNKFRGPFSLTIVGNSSFEENGESYRRILSNSMSDELIKNTHFHDFMRPEDFQVLFKSADVFIIPSPFENFPYAAIEAILRGIPVIASKYSGLADFQTDDSLIFDPSDPQSLQKLIKSTGKLWEDDLLKSRASEQFTAFKSFIENNSPSDVSFDLAPTISSHVVRWQLKTKIPMLAANDSLLISGRFYTDIFPAILNMSSEAGDMLVAFSSEHEVFIEIDEILHRELPFLLPLLTENEAERINEDNFLGILHVMAGRKKIVSVFHPISKVATGLRVDYFDLGKLEFLRSRGSFR